MYITRVLNRKGDRRVGTLLYIVVGRHSLLAVGWDSTSLLKYLDVGKRGKVMCPVYLLVKSEQPGYTINPRMVGLVTKLQ